MENVLLVLHVLVSLALIVLVLLQQGKGADAGAAFGSGASATVFGASGSASFLTRATAVLATIFFATSLSLAYFSGKQVVHKSVTEEVTAPAATKAAPAKAKSGDSDVPAVPQQAPAPATEPKKK